MPGPGGLPDPRGSVPGPGGGVVSGPGGAW